MKNLMKLEMKNKNEKFKETNQALQNENVQ